MNVFLESTRKDVAAFLSAYLAEKGKLFRGINAWGPDAVRKLRPFVRTGKMLRAGLVATGSALAGRRPGPSAIRAGAAVELIQAALLIHDDIMDRDPVRRGAPSLHRQYESQALRMGVREPAHFGAGMALCLGDIAFFLGFELLSTLPEPAERRAAIVSLWADELCRVGLGQMQDLYFGEAFPAVEDADVLRLYLYKTARYSFSVPLLTGARLGGAPASLLRRLASIGETMGILFQLRDDEIGLFGSENQTGKPVGSDIRESKMTLLSRRLFERAGARDRARLSEAFGNPRLGARVLSGVRELAGKLGLRVELREEMEKLHARAGRAIDRLDAPAGAIRVLRDVLDFSLNRIR